MATITLLLFDDIVSVGINLGQHRTEIKSSVVGKGTPSRAGNWALV